MAFFLILNALEIYSVIPKNFLSKKLDLFIGPLINLFVILFFNRLNAISKHFLI